MNDLKVKNVGQLAGAIRTLFNNYNSNFHIFGMRQLAVYILSEQQFATLICRCRMYPYLPRSIQNDIKPLQLGDNQIGRVVKDYYKDESFCKLQDCNHKCSKPENYLN